MCLRHVFVKVWKWSEVLPPGVVKGFEVLGGASALCFKVLICSDVLLPCVFTGLEVFGFASAYWFSMIWSVRRCFRLVFFQVLQGSEVLLPCAFKGFEVFGGASALFLNVLKCSDVLPPYDFQWFEVFGGVFAMCFWRFWSVLRCFEVSGCAFEVFWGVSGGSFLLVSIGFSRIWGVVTPFGLYIILKRRWGLHSLHSILGGTEPNSVAFNIVPGARVPNGCRWSRIFALCRVPVRQTGSGRAEVDVLSSIVIKFLTKAGSIWRCFSSSSRLRGQCLRCMQTMHIHDTQFACPTFCLALSVSVRDE